MSFFEKLFSPKKHSVEDAGTLLLSLAKKRGLSNENRDPVLAWAIFKEFCLTCQFTCDDDALLWEIGPYGNAEKGGHSFQWHLVRQFIVESGEDEDISQVYMDMTYSGGMEEERTAVVWSYDIEGDFSAFFAAAEACPDFSLPQGAALLSVSVGLDKV